MARFAASLTTSAGSTTLPICALVGGTGAVIRVIEIGVWNTTTTAVGLQMVRLSTAGTPGTAATSRLLNQSDAQTPVGALRNTYTSTAPTTADLGMKFALGASIGSGVVLNFNDYELSIATTASSAIGFVTDAGVNTGTGQACYVYFRWIE